MCCASQALPPFPITQSRCPAAKRAAISAQSAPIFSAFPEKNASFTATDSRHLRITRSAKSAVEAQAAIDSLGIGRILFPEMAPILVVCRAGALCGNHSRAERTLGGA